MFLYIYDPVPVIDIEQLFSSSVIVELLTYSCLCAGSAV